MGSSQSKGKGKADPQLRRDADRIAGQDAALVTDHVTAVQKPDLDPGEEAFRTAKAHSGARRYQKAISWFEKSLNARQIAFGPSHPLVLETITCIAFDHLGLVHRDKARRWFHEGLLRCVDAYGVDHASTIEALRPISMVYFRTGYLADDVATTRLIVEISGRVHGEDDDKTASFRKLLQARENELVAITHPLRYAAQSQSDDSLALRQALAALHGLPIPGDPFANVQAISTRDLFSDSAFGSVAGVRTGGAESSRLASQRAIEDSWPASFSYAVDIPSYYSPPSVDIPSYFSPPQVDILGLAPATTTSENLLSLFNRSLEAWQRLHGDETVPLEHKQQSVNKYWNILRGVQTLDELLELEDCQFWFFQRSEVFMTQKVFPKWDPARLDDYVLIPAGDTFTNEQDCFFISHYWNEAEHPDRTGDDFRQIKGRCGASREGNYIWVDWTCMPQQPRTEPQRQYFKRALKSIPKLVRHCNFVWHFPEYRPRLWILFEVAQYTLNRAKIIPLKDTTKFMEHLSDMQSAGVQYVADQQGYKCTNDSDGSLVTCWLELLAGLFTLVPSVRYRREILDTLDDPQVQTCSHEETGVKVDKGTGIITAHGQTHKFSPIPFEPPPGSASGLHVNIKSRLDDQLAFVQRKVHESNDLPGCTLREFAGKYTREGDYKVAEALLRQLLAEGKDGPGTLLDLVSSLEKQDRLQEALETLAQLPENRLLGRNDSSGLKLKAKLQSKLREQEDRRLWKLMSLEKILQTSPPKPPTGSRPHKMPSSHSTRQPDAGTTRRGKRATALPSEPPLDANVPNSIAAVMLRSMEQDAIIDMKKRALGSARAAFWYITERRKEVLGYDHPETLRAMTYLANTMQLQRLGTTGAGSIEPTSRKLYALALVLSDNALGPAHPDTVAIMSQTAALYLSVGRRADAKEMYRRQFERQARAHGVEHPNCYTARTNLLNLLGPGEELRITDETDIMRQGNMTVEIHSTRR